MTTLNLEIDKIEKEILESIAKESKMNLSEYVINKLKEIIEDYEDMKLAEERLNDKDNFISGDMKSLAEKYGINYEEL